MIPKAELIYAHDFVKRLYQGEAEKFDEAWLGFVNQGELFEIVFDKAIETILINMPKVTGYDWPLENSFLPVYLVIDGQAFAQPLTLVVTSNPEQMLYDLIRILTQLNIKSGFINDEKRDQIFQKVVQEVIESSNLDLSDAINDADLVLREKYGANYQASDLDLTSHPLRYYLKNK